MYLTCHSELGSSSIFLLVSALILILMCFFPVAPNDSPNSLYYFQQRVKNDPRNKLVIYPVIAGCLLDGLACLLLWLISLSPAAPEFFRQLIRG